MRRSHHQPIEAGLDISPLIDMVFILLIFFMVSSNFVKDMDLELERPGAQSSAPASAKALRRLRRSPGRHLRRRAAGEGVDAAGARARIPLAASDAQRVLVVADGQVPTLRLVEVVDQRPASRAPSTSASRPQQETGG